jgi:hypothetical protein
MSANKRSERSGDEGHALDDGDPEGSVVASEKRYETCSCIWKKFHLKNVQKEAYNVFHYFRQAKFAYNLASLI